MFAVLLPFLITYLVERELGLEALNYGEGNTVDWYDSDTGVEVISADDIEKMKSAFTEQLSKLGFLNLYKRILILNQKCNLVHLHLGIKA